MDSVLVACYETPSIFDMSHRPTVINHSNFLHRRPGSAFIAGGEIIYIRGRVSDQNCVPVQGAVVTIWQADSHGVYSSDKSGISGFRYDSNFSGSGMAITDNLGYYEFITVFPGSSSGRAPHINFVVQHPDFVGLSTEMFFADQDNSVDSVLTKYVAEDEMSLLVAPYEILNGKKNYFFNLTLSGTEEHRSY